MGAVLQAMRWAAQIALGWATSDIYNEYNTSKQLTGKGSVGNAVITTAKVKWWMWLVGFVGLGIVTFLIITIVRLIRGKS